MSQINLQLSDGTIRPCAADLAVVAVTAGGATKTVTFNNVKKIQVVKSVSITNSSNVRRGASGAVTFDTNVLTIADASFANGDTIVAEVIGYN
ncbi:hypothetical protein [Mesorhizobium sp.]|uniref:hypothetical protein n=1 Tax=Mesorhizobium sp. TaxID=1871066 RepID=UPI000FE61F47|nr:hypothetical protein [Mesorhizobium sp.]RWE44230.1 MAG: hypothetical protein EOS80_20025 [Mesorhizobium sp.]